MFNKLIKNFIKLGFFSTLKKILFYPIIHFFLKENKLKNYIGVDLVSEIIKTKTD